MGQKKKAVLITGATKRLGLALTKQSLDMGFSVIAHYRTSAAPLKSWLTKHPRFSDRIYFLQADLAEKPESLIDTCSDFPAALTGLVNNASQFTEGNLDNLNHLRNLMAINAVAPLLIARRFSQKVGKGWIINITDADISLNKKFQNYRLSKRILTELTCQMAFLYAPGIRVNAIAPGAILPPIHADRSHFNRLKSTLPLRKTGDTKAIQQAYSFLVENNSITGQILSVDNGHHLINDNTFLQWPE